MQNRIFTIAIVISLAFLAISVLAQDLEITITPPDSTVFNCNRETITIEIATGGHAWHAESLHIDIDGFVYDTSARAFSADSFGCEIELALSPWDGSDTANFCLHNISFIDTVYDADSLCWSYYFDFDDEAPTIEFLEDYVSPLYLPGDTIREINRFLYRLSDSSGLNVESIWVSIEDTIYNIDSDCLWLSSDRLFFRCNIECNGLYFPVGDTMIDICIHVQDNYEPCPNTLDTCYQLYIAPRDYCNCTAGFYVARWESIRDDVHTPIYMVVDSLATHYDYFALDTEIDVFNPGSLDVYYVLPWTYYYPPPDSAVDLIQDYVYNGGILYLWGETAGVLTSQFDFIKRDEEWFMGLEPRGTRIFPEGSYFDSFNSPYIEPIDSGLRINWSGSIKLSNPAIRIAGLDSTGYSYFYPHRDSIDDYAPTAIAMSHYGRGTVFIHMDYTSLKNGIDYGFASYPMNMSINYDLPCCENIPRFTHYPEQNIFFNCQDDSIFITTTIENFGIIEPESLYVFWQDSMYDFSSLLLEIYDSSFSFIIPPESYHDDDTLFLCIHNIIDTTGYWTYDSICWSYYFQIDEQPPAIEILYPEIGDTIGEIDEFYFTLSDSNYLDTTSFLLTFEDDYEFSIGHPAIWHFGDTFFFEPSLAGIEFGEVDTFLDICIHIADANQDCTPQALDTCWQVYLNASAISESSIKPDDKSLSVYPNPFNSSCYIDGPSGHIAKIYDAEGKLINNIILPGRWDGIDMDGDDVAGGVYLIKAKDQKISVKYVK
ncbi:MAG: T9SS type A sorting domain-containing protein [Candidatus Zixiibacteriota bacterium]